MNWIQNLKKCWRKFTFEQRDREQAIALSKMGIIYGDDAKRFHERMKEAETKKVPKEEVDRIKASYEAIKAKANFNP